MEEAQLQTLHGGVGLTMTKVWSRYCIPKLRKLVKNIYQNCHDCKSLQAMVNSAKHLKPSNHPNWGLDYDGPLRYHISRQWEGKAFILQGKLLDMEITLNDQPLSYLEDDPQLPVLTLSSMLFVNSKVLPELQPQYIETAGLHTQAKHLLKYKEAVSRHWSKEYLLSLCKKHRAQATARG